MKIHQLAVTYLPEQDRILARVNTTESEEVRIWLTRRLTLALWPLLNQALTEQLVKLEAAVTSGSATSDDMKSMLVDFRKQELLSNADFATPYKEGKAALPMGEEPMLATDATITALATGRLRLVLHERPPNSETQRNFTVELEPRLMQGFLHLLEQAVAQSEWRQVKQAPIATLPEAAAEGRPKYLN